MKIGELARQSGLTVHTIRYYEQIGLLPPARRDDSGQRTYEKSTLTWIAFLGRLKTTGMSIQEMLRYAVLRAHGADTEQERLTLLSEHREVVRRGVAELQDCLLILDQKIAGYTSTYRVSNNAKHNESARTEPDGIEPDRIEARNKARKRQTHPVGD